MTACLLGRDQESIHDILLVLKFLVDGRDWGNWVSDAKQSEWLDNCVRWRLVQIMRLVGFEVRMHDVIGSYSGARLSVRTHCAMEEKVMIEITLYAFSSSTHRHTS